MNRRKFLLASSAVLANLVGVSLAKLNEGKKENKQKSDHPGYIFVVDTRKCIGCGRCVRACKIENDVPLEPYYFRTWVERYVWLKGEEEPKVDSPNGGFDGFPEIYDEKEVVKSYFVPKLCNQCKEPPCVQVCPVGATYKTPDGVILVDEKYCIGCRYCIQACPYGARYLYPINGPRESRRGTADKCTWCYHRITKGLLPACVLACPTQARRFGRADDERLLKLIEENPVSVLKPEQGTKPRVFYIGIDSEVR